MHRSRYTLSKAPQDREPKHLLYGSRLLLMRLDSGRRCALADDNGDAARGLAARELAAPSATAASAGPSSCRKCVRCDQLETKVLNLR